jgi:hypothetical protein
MLSVMIFKRISDHSYIFNLRASEEPLPRAERPSAFIKQLRLILKIIPINDTIILKALESEFHGSEDGVQYHAALAHRLDYIITRNTGDYKKLRITVCTSDEFLKINY